MKYKILVADDSRSYLDVIEETFGLIGDNCDLIWAGTGKMACEMAEDYLPDLILMDVIMPEMNGIQAVKYLKANNHTAEIPVIMLSAPESLKAAFEAGAHDFISKPFNRYELLMRVKSSLALIDKIKETRKQKERLEKEHEEVTRQRKEMIDDITYSKRIQKAILPTNDFVNEVFPENFVLFLPKNIVSGDFYWIGKKEDKRIIAAADCTGHGISGAFMTMAGIAFMNDIINRHDFKNPAEILFLLREEVMKLLNQRGIEGEAADGMDVALCIIDEKKKVMQYAGANNPAYLVRNDELTILKADRMPIGIHVNFNHPFTNQEIEVQNNDLIYLFSDGYPDQFGGPLNKKFRYKQFQELLVENCSKPLVHQKNMLYKTFIDWKGNEEQVDDILVMGIRVHTDKFR